MIGLSLGLSLSARGGGGGDFTILNPEHVKLLAHFDGTHGATTTTDSSPVGRAITISSGGSISTAQSVFGGSSLALAASVIYCDDSDDWVFDGPFTIAARVRYGSLGHADEVIAAQWASSQLGWSLRTTSGDASEFAFLLSAGGSAVATTIATTGAGIGATDTWHDVMVDRDASGVIRLYSGGVMRGKGTDGSTTYNSTAKLGIGSEVDVAGTVSGRRMGGFIDELLIMNGEALCGSDDGYTTPTEPFSLAI